MINLQHAKMDPSSEFESPRDVLNERSLSREDKIDILRRWAYDERELAVAEEENMLSSNANHNNRLHEISQILLELGLDSDEGSPPTKQG